MDFTKFRYAKHRFCEILDAGKKRRVVEMKQNQIAGGHPTLKDGVCFGPPARLLGKIYSVL